MVTLPSVCYGAYSRHHFEHLFSTQFHLQQTPFSYKHDSHYLHCYGQLVQEGIHGHIWSWSNQIRIWSKRLHQKAFKGKTFILAVKDANWDSHSQYQSVRDSPALLLIAISCWHAPWEAADDDPTTGSLPPIREIQIELPAPRFSLAYPEEPVKRKLFYFSAFI